MAPVRFIDETDFFRAFFCPKFVRLPSEHFVQRVFHEFAIFGIRVHGPFLGVSHMMMIESNPSPGRHSKATNLQVMDVMLAWTKANIKAPKTIECDDDDDDHHDHDDDDDHGHH